jgi:hypothetical protein
LPAISNPPAPRIADHQASLKTRFAERLQLNEALAAQYDLVVRAAAYFRTPVTSIALPANLNVRQPSGRWKLKASAGGGLCYRLLPIA